MDASKGGKGHRPALAGLYPTIARWASGYGWVEFGIDGLDRPFVRALDEGGTVWERESEHETLDDALADLEEGLARFMKEQGFVDPAPARAVPRRPAKAARKSKPVAGKSTRRPADPATKKVEKLLEIAEALRRGEDFSITRLTVLKGLCEDLRAAGEFALFLARKAQKKLRTGEAPDRYRKLVDRAVREMKPYLADPDDERRERLHVLLREMHAEQDEHRNIAWGSVRLIESMDLLVAEKCLRAVLRPDEAPQWLYQAARDYCERYNSRYGTGLIPSSAPMVQDVADFWRKATKGGGTQEVDDRANPSKLLALGGVVGDDVGDRLPHHRRRSMSTAARSLRRDPAEVEPWAETCGQIRPLVEEHDGAAAEVHHVEIDHARLHYHERTDEVYYVIDGQGTMVLDDETIELHKGVVVYVPRGVKHKAIGKLTVLTVCIPRGVLHDVHELE